MVTHFPISYGIPYITDLEKLPLPKIYIPIKKTEMNDICEYLKECSHKYVVMQTRTLVVNNKIRWFNNTDWDPDMEINRIIKKRQLRVIPLFKDTRDHTALRILEFLIVQNCTLGRDYFDKEIYPDSIKNVLIVGNGPRGFRENTGALIDASDYVIRMNRFRIEGYEDMAGRKCDVAIQGASKMFCYENNMMRLDDIKKHAKVIAITENIHKRVSQIMSLDSYKIMPFSIFNKFAIEFKMRSTGLFTIINTIIRYLDTDTQIRIVGFSHHDGSDRNSESYYYGTFNLGTDFNIDFHNFDAQKKYITWLIRNHIIYEL